MGPKANLFHPGGLINQPLPTSENLKITLTEKEKNRNPEDTSVIKPIIISYSEQDV